MSQVIGLRELTYSLLVGREAMVECGTALSEEVDIVADVCRSSL